jgi:hypothetical protein
MHEFVDETGQSLVVARDYYGEALKGNVNLGADVKQFGTATTGAVGQSLGTAGDYYFSQVPKGQAKLGSDIGQAGSAVANYWNSLDTEQKGHFFGKQVVPLAVPGAVGIVAKEVQGVNLIGKAGEAITSFRGPQLMPVYAEGFVPAQAIAAANVGRITDHGTNLTLPGVLLMSEAKGDGMNTGSGGKKDISRSRKTKDTSEDVEKEPSKDTVDRQAIEVLKTQALPNGLSIELCRNTCVFNDNMLEMRIATPDGRVIGTHRLTDIENLFSKAVDKYSCLSSEQIEQAGSSLTTRNMRNGLKIEAYKDDPESAHSFRVRVVTPDGIALNMS